ncbi:MAG: MFS transporter [Pseudomonadota bacterium]
MLKPLRNAQYARLFAAQIIALMGTGLTTVALALLAFELAGDSAGEVLGIALAIKMVAYVTLAPVAGGIAQLLPRKAYLITLDLARAGLVLCLPFVTEIWQIFLLIFFLQACSAGFSPVFQASIPDILEDEEDYTKALALSRLAYDVESLVSPALAGAALLLVSFDALFAANAAAFLASAMLVAAVSFPVSRPETAPERFTDRITFGLRAYLATPRLRGLLAMSMAVAAAGAMVIVNTVVLVQGSLGLSEEWTALLLMAFGCGSMVTALILPRTFQLFDDRPVCMAAGSIMVVSLALGTLQPGFSAAAVLWFMIGIGYSAVLVSAGRLLQRSSTKPDRPAYFAAQFALSHACWLVTYPLAGWAGSVFGLTTAFALLAMLALASLLTAMRVWPNEDASDLFHRHEALDHTHLHVHDTHHQHAHEGWEGPEPHNHPHSHSPMHHRHTFTIDPHHMKWPS